MLEDQETKLRSVVTGLERGHGVVIHNWYYENYKGTGLTIPDITVLWSTKKGYKHHKYAELVEEGARAYYWDDCTCGECSDWLSSSSGTERS